MEKQIENEYADANGTTVKVGDIVAYSQSSGNQSIYIGTVESIFSETYSIFGSIKNFVTVEIITKKNRLISRRPESTAKVY